MLLAFQATPQEVSISRGCRRFMHLSSSVLTSDGALNFKAPRIRAQTLIYCDLYSSRKLLSPAEIFRGRSVYVEIQSIGNHLKPPLAVVVAALRDLH